MLIGEIDYLQYGGPSLRQSPENQDCQFAATSSYLLKKYSALLTAFGSVSPDDHRLNIIKLDTPGILNISRRPSSWNINHTLKPSPD